jgi:hypothetical protein
MESRPEPEKKMPMKKKAAPAPAKKAATGLAVPSRTAAAAPARGMAARRASPRRVGGASPARSASTNKNADHNKKFIEQIKGASIELRKTGADVETDPTLELGLLLDCTSSMSSWITKAKETIREIIDNVIKECEEDGSLKCRVSFVGYRDIKDTRRFELMPFNENVDEVKKFIQSVTADGGADEPEDMQGGLKLCLLQDWTEEATKRVVLITDAPPHGTKYHESYGDDYPNGSPEGLVLEDLMKEFCKKEIDFQVIKLNQSANKTIEVMKEHHQDIEVTDMSGVKDEIRAARREEAEAMGGGGGEVSELVTHEEEEMYMKEKFVKHAVKGMASKVKAKKGGW